MYRLVTFDANGTLLKLRFPVAEIYIKIAKKYGVNADSSIVENNFKSAWKAFTVKYPNFGLKSIGWRDWWKNVVFQSLCDGEKNVIDKKCLEPVADELVDIFSSKQGWNLADGCIETLNFLKSKHTEIGVISNFDPRLHDILKSLDIYRYFNFIIISYEANVMKPDRKIFELSEENCKAVIKDRSKEILHIGDNVDLDYMGSIQAGWGAALISSNKKLLTKTHPAVNPLKVFCDLHELSEYLKKTIV